MTRPINQIAAEIDTEIRDLKRNSNASWIQYSQPYVRAMLEMRRVTDFYGLDSGEQVVRRFLVNAQPWRGDNARRIKAELNQALKEANVPH